MSNTIVILGASVRAAAFSALAANLRPVGGDLFADADLAARAPVAAVRPYPAGLEAVARAAPAGPWMYTGALENGPELVDRISRQRPLYGNPGRVLVRVRDPLAVCLSLDRAGLNAPESRFTSAGLPRNGLWLCKPRKSSGGRRVQVLTTDFDVGRDESAWYFQRRIEGLPCAAVFVAAGGDARLLGVTEQLLRPGRAGRQSFCYAGSLGPLRLGVPAATAFDQIGRALSRDFELRGLFGVDAILAGDTVWPVEVNPRYSASVEVLEQALEFSAVGWHVAACRDGRLPPSGDVSHTTWCGKEILFAAADIEIPQRFTEHAMRHNRGIERPEVADIPAPRTRLAAGQPILTVLGQADAREEMRQTLRERLQHWKGLLARTCTGR